MMSRLPAGFSTRPAHFDDLEPVVELLNRAAHDLHGKDEFTVDDYRNEWMTPNFNLETDSLLVFSQDNQLVGYCEVWDIFNPPARVMVWQRVNPDYPGLGIGACMLDWAEKRARQAIQRAPQGSRVVLHSYVPHIDEAAGKLFEKRGFRPIRHLLRMVINLNGRPPVPRWPAGIVVRTKRVGEEEAILRADIEIFKDHYGFVETSFEEEYERWRHFTLNDPDYDPSLWFLAVDGAKIAGISLCKPKIAGDPDMGCVGTLGVRRPWRRRGIGLALLQHSFREFYRRGICKVGLGVDAQSLTGATRLYQKAGMRPDPCHRHDLYAKELRPGVELYTTELEFPEGSFA